MKKLGLLFSLLLAMATPQGFANTKSNNVDCPSLLATPKIVSERVAQRSAQVTELISAYNRRLGLYADPFALVFSPEEGTRVFNRLSLRLDKDGRWTYGPLAYINFNLKRGFIQQNPYRDRLVNWIIAESARQVEDSQVAREDLQGNLLALKYTLTYLRRYSGPAGVDRDGDPVEDGNKGESNDSKPKQNSPQKQESSKDQKAEFPELPKEYIPHTKDIENKSGEKKEPTVIASVNFKTPFWSQRFFNTVERGASAPFMQTDLPLTPKPLGPYKKTDKELTIYPMGKKQFSLYIPPGYRPLQSDDVRAKITALPSGEYSVILNADVPSLKIPLVPDENLRFLGHVVDVFRRPVGIKKEEWPDLIRIELLQRFSLEQAQKDPISVAQAVSTHIRTKYLYSVNGKPDSDPIAALKAGAFQCDLAAYIMVGVLRDYFNIPSRAVGGFRAKELSNSNKKESYLVVPGQAHAWVEVYHEGKWHSFDPTPEKRDKESNESLDKENPYQDISPEDSSSNPQDRENSQEQAQRSDEVKSEPKTNAAQPPPPPRAEDNASDAPMSLDDLAAQLKIGSLEMDPSETNNPLRDRILRVLMRDILAPDQRGADILSRLHMAQGIVRNVRSVELKETFVRALEIHGKDHRELKAWVESLVYSLPKEDVNKSYHEIQRVKESIEVYGKFLDSAGGYPVRYPEKLLSKIAAIQEAFKEIAHADSNSIGLTKEFIDTLPPLVASHIKSNYGIETVGPNSPTINVAEDLVNGQLNDMRLLAELSPLTDFILNSTPRPEKIEVRTWARDSRRPRGTDLLSAQRFAELGRAILGQPLKSALENLLEGTAYVPTRRQVVDISAGYGKDEAERVTIVLYDTSGSMANKPADFQAGLIAAFAGNALSDVSPSGKHRHKLVILPFDGTPGEPILVNNRAEALDIISNYRVKLGNTQGDTDIQGALMQAMSLVADAQKRAGEPLAAANIILMTDGQANVDAEELRRAREALIDRSTPLQTMFISINGTNEKLQEFAMNSQAMGSEKGFYREFDNEAIEKHLNAARRKIRLDERDDFYSDRAASEIPQKIYRLMDEVLHLTGDLNSQIYYSRQIRTPEEHLRDLEKLQWPKSEVIDRDLEGWIMRARTFLRGVMFERDSRLHDRVIDDLVSNFEKLTGISKNALSQKEQEQLRHLVRKTRGDGIK